MQDNDRPRPVGEVVCDPVIQRSLSAALREVARPGCALEVWDFLRWRVCTASGETDGLTQAYIAAQIGKSASGVSRAMKTLTQIGVVAGRRPDERNPERLRYKIAGCAYRLAPGATQSCAPGKALAPSATHMILDDDDIIFIKSLRSLLHHHQDSYSLRPAQQNGHDLAPGATSPPPVLRPAQVAPLHSLNSAAYVPPAQQNGHDLAPGATSPPPVLRPAQVEQHLAWLEAFGVADPGTARELAGLPGPVLLAWMLDAQARDAGNEHMVGRMVKRVRAGGAPPDQHVERASALLDSVEDFDAAALRAALVHDGNDRTAYFEEEFAEFVMR